MIHIDRLNLAVGQFALHELSLDIHRGEYFVLLGPSGSGKTLLLESLCGLNRIDSGRIVVGDRDVTLMEPRRRGVGYLPQDYALFPHRTVAQNVAFGLRYGAVPTADRAERVGELLELVGAEHLRNRLPNRLSGGEKQRVALARALAIRPNVLMLDEPVSALDEQTRDHLCRQLKKLQHETKTTMVHVCHNFAEMMAVADRVGVIHEGRVLQVGTPLEILQFPRNRFVAEFVQTENLLPVTVFPDGDWVKLQWSEDMAFYAPRARVAQRSGEAVAAIRPENIELAADEPTDSGNADAVFQVSIESLSDAGSVVRLTVVGAAGLRLTVSIGKREYISHGFSVGQAAWVAIAPDEVHVLPDSDRN